MSPDGLLNGRIIFDQFCDLAKLRSTCVSALREIHQSLQCKIFQYTFLRQYVMKFQHFLLLVKI